MSYEAPLPPASLQPGPNPPPRQPGPARERLRLASLFSGGKDSAYAAYVARETGHDIACLVSLFGRSEESLLLHNPNIRWVWLQAEAMGNMPLVSDTIGSDDIQEEMDALESLLRVAKSEFGIQGVVHGGIRSKFQRSRFAQVCGDLGLKTVTPLWQERPEAASSYMRRLLDDGFDVIITAVSAGGLDGKWLGRRITHDSLDELLRLSKRHGFAPDFEGGEAETFVTYCPLFEHSISIGGHNTIWDGYRGRFEILDARLDRDA